MALPSWLQGPDVLGAMRGGAALGLSARAQDQAAEEFAAHLALQHDQLNAQQAKHAATLAQAQARAAEALRQHNALEIYRQKNLEQQARLREEAMGRQEAAQAARDALAERRLGLSEESGRRQEESGKRAESMLQLHMDRENRLAGGKEASLNALAAAAKELPADDPRRTAIDDLIAQKAGIPNVQSPAVKNLVDEYAKVSSAAKAGSSGTFLGLGTRNDARMKQIENELRGLGWTTEGTRIGGSTAAKALSLPEGPTEDAYQGITPPVVPPGTPGMTPPKYNKRIRVQSPDGKVGSIPEDQLDDALKSGYTPL